MNHASRTIQQCLYQIQNWDATTDTIYAMAAVGIAYIFIVVTRDKARR